MEAIVNETVDAQRLPWSRPQVRRLVISLNTSASGLSGEDCDGFGPECIE